MSVVAANFLPLSRRQTAREPLSVILVYGAVDCNNDDDPPTAFCSFTRSEPLEELRPLSVCRYLPLKLAESIEWVHTVLSDQFKASFVRIEYFSPFYTIAKKKMFPQQKLMTVATDRQAGEQSFFVVTLFFLVRVRNTVKSSIFAATRTNIQKSAFPCLFVMGKKKDRDAFMHEFFFRRPLLSWSYMVDIPCG